METRSRTGRPARRYGDRGSHSVIDGTGAVPLLDMGVGRSAAVLSCW